MDDFREMERFREYEKKYKFYPPKSDNSSGINYINPYNEIISDPPPKVRFPIPDNPYYLCYPPNPENKIVIKKTTNK